MTISKQQGFVLAVGVLVLAAGLRLWQIAHLPPGLWIDEAFFLLWTQKIMRGEALPIYIFPDNTGNETLFVYLSTITVSILGPVKWAGRLVAAWMGLIGVAFTIRGGWAFFVRRSMGVLAGLVLAVLYWDIHFSHFGNLPILATTAAAGTMAGFGYGMHTGRRWAYVLAGLCLGLGLNAYVAFRLFTFVPLCVGLVFFIARRDRRRELLKGSLVMAGVAGLVCAPLGLFFIQQPQWFFNRFSQTTGGTLGDTSPAMILLTNAIKTVGGIFFVGDSNWRHNLSGRPALDAAQAFFSLVGAGVCLWRWRKPESWILLIWLLIGFSPSVLTIDAPHFGRTTMVTPAVALLTAVGIVVIWNKAANRVARSLIVIAIMLSSVLTVRDYFWRWAQAPELALDFSTEQTQIAFALKAAAPANAWLYITPRYVSAADGYWSYWTTEYIMGEQAFPRLRMFNGSQCVLLPAETTQLAVYAVSEPDDVTTPALLQTAFSGVTRTPAGRLPSGSALAIYQIPSGQTAQIQVDTPITASFGDLVQMRGYTLSSKMLEPGTPLDLTVIWKTLRPATETYKVFVHLVGPAKPDGNIIYAQQDIEPCADRYPTSAWRTGELMVDHYRLSVPTDLTAGSYIFQIGWYAEATGRLPVTDASEQALGEALVLERFQVSAP